MANDEKPLSMLISQGWELVSYATGGSGEGVAPYDSFLLRRNKVHKLLKVRKKIIGRGYVVSETEL